VAGQLVAFLGVSAIVIMTPGPDTALTIRNPAIRRVMDAVTGTVLIALGLRLATERR
jgi:threonine/homoserine/homoserine lactone efflux protein